MRLTLLAVLGVMAIAPASASAATTLNVNTEADGPLTSGNECGGGVEECTLRAAIERADKVGEVTIELPAGTYAVSEGALAVDDDAEVTVHGSGAASTIIESNGSDRVFEVEDTSELTLDGVTITGGDQDEGAGIYAEGSLTVENSTVTKNHANDEGGGIYVEGGGSASLRNSTISDDTAFEGGGIYGEDGSSVAVLESTITGNEAKFGGGIAIENGSACVVRIESRHAHADVKPSFESGLASGLTVSRSTIEGNIVHDGLGGGIYDGPFCGFLEDAKAGVSSVKPASLVEQEGGLAIDQTTIAGNSAEGELGIGGGIYEETGLVEDPIVDSTITGNTAASTGGGLADGAGEAVLVSDTVADNKVEGPTEEQPSALHAWRGVGAGAKPNVVALESAGENLAASPDREETAIELRNTIVAETSGEGENCEGAVESLLEGEGHNLDIPSRSEEEATSDSCGMSAADKDLVNVNPQLDPAGLQANGGPTRTIALLSSSPAIGVVPIAGDCVDSEDGPALANGEGTPVPVDQRSAPRPGIPGRECDVGAYEYQLPGATPPAKPEVKPAAQVLGVKIASPVCASKRDITIHIQNVKQFGVVSAVVSVNGKAKRKLAGSRLRTAINLVGLPKGTFTVSIVAQTRSGQTLHGKRVYHTCHTRLPGHLHLHL